MKVRAYIRIAKKVSKNKDVYEIDAGSTSNSSPLVTYNGKSLPTVGFAVDFDLEDDIFEQMLQPIAEVSITKNIIKGNVKIPTKSDIVMDKLKGAI